MSSLDLLLLALIEDGVSTPYEIGRAGVSIGASQPALRRLITLKFVRRGPEGIRRRAEYSLTAQGRAELKKWQQMLDDYLISPPRDLESVLRVVAVALSRGKRDRARELLGAAEESWSARLRAADVEGVSGAGRLAETYKLMIGYAESSRLRAEVEALQRLKRDIEQLQNDIPRNKRMRPSQ